MKSDFSSFALWTAGLSWLTGVYGYTTPVGDTPTGNPIYTPGLNDIVPVGTPYNITWNPTTTGTVTLVLLRGPSTNVVPLYSIVEQIPNDGYYLWTPATNLEADTTHYGLQLIVDATGAYQYSTQFGISNTDSSSSSSSVSSGSTTTVTVASASASTLSTWTSTSASASSSSVSVVVAPFAANSTTTAVYVASTGWAAPSSNVTLTKSLSLPSSIATNAAGATTSAAVTPASTPSTVTFQGAASTTKISALAIAVVAAGFAFAM